MSLRTQTIKMLKQAERGWEKTYFTKAVLQDIIFLLEDKDREKKRAKITALPTAEETEDVSQP